MKFCDLGEVADASKIVREPRRVAKATVQRSGNLGFSKTAGEVMALSADKKLLLIPSGPDLYAKVVGSEDVRGFRLTGARDYISMPAQEFLRSMGIDYADKTKTCIFDIVRYGEDEADGAVIWKFTKRVRESRVRAKETLNEETQAT